MQEIVRAEGLSVRYPYAHKPTLRDISFSLAQGERVLLLGSSGSGKSTLGLCLNGIIPHRIEAELQGSLSVFGHNVLRSEPALLTQKVGYVFQDPESQFCMLYVEDEIAFGLENLRLPSDEIERRIGHALEQVGLEAKRHTRLDCLSGGEKQRIALAAALAMEPQLLVLDEVTSNLDPAGARQMLDVVRRSSGRITREAYWSSSIVSTP